MLNPALYAVVAANSPPGRSSTAQGLFGAAGTVGFIIASLIAGVLAGIEHRLPAVRLQRGAGDDARRRPLRRARPVVGSQPRAGLTPHHWPMRDLPSGTATFLFTDIEGSTRLLHEHGADYVELLAEHRRVLRAVFARHDGVEVDTQGDAFFVAFGRATDAVDAAAAIQQTEGPVRVRIGIHTGTPTVTTEGYVGIDVHRAARICAAAHGGQVVLSEAAREALGHDPGRDLGLHRLKDLGAPERLFQLGTETFPPLRSLNATNLPAQMLPLVGRVHELAELAGLIRVSRLVTLTGAGGSGKTRLALQAAADSVEAFGGGVSGCRSPPSPIRRSSSRPSRRRSERSMASPSTSVRNGCSFCSTTSSSSCRVPPPHWPRSWRPARTCGCFSPRGRRSGSRANANSRPRRCRPPMPSSYSSNGRTAPNLRRRSMRSVAVSTASRSRSSWRRRGRDSCHPTSSSPDSSAPCRS